MGLGDNQRAKAVTKNIWFSAQLSKKGNQPTTIGIQVVCSGKYWASAIARQVRNNNIEIVKGSSYRAESVVISAEPVHQNDCWTVAWVVPGRGSSDIAAVGS
jgi:2-C-methyl-D-erythritol 4-phosphate cytidylyltransferase